MEEAFEFCEPLIAEAVRMRFHELEPHFGRVESISIGEGTMEGWLSAFCVLEEAEIWRTHSDWIRTESPTLGSDVWQRLAEASRIRAEVVEGATIVQREACEILAQVLDESTVLGLPTTPCVAPMRSAPSDRVAAFRKDALRLCCPAGLAGLPQVSSPSVVVSGCPVGLSFIGAAGSDLALLELARITAGV